MSGEPRQSAHAAEVNITKCKHVTMESLGISVKHDVLYMENKRLTRVSRVSLI